MTTRIYISQDLFNKGRINVYAEDVFIGYCERLSAGWTVISTSSKSMNIGDCKNWLVAVKTFLANNQPKEIKEIEDNNQLSLF